MKHLHTALLSLLALLVLSGCAFRSDDLIPLEDPATYRGEKTRLTFNVEMPERPYAATLRSSTGNITDETTLSASEHPDLWVLVFRAGAGSESAFTFLYAVKATYQADLDPDDGDEYYTYTGDFIPTDQPRTFHVIGGYDFTGFDFTKYLDADEGELLAELKGAGSYLWSRKGLNNIPDNINVHVGDLKINLMRSLASVEVKDGSPSGNKLGAEAAFTVINVPDIGMVAPFNPETGRFPNLNNLDTYKDDPNWVITEAPGANLVQPNDLHPISAPIFINERSNSTSTSPVYVILRALNGEENTGTYYYYKIDLIYGATEAETKRYDIKRNYKYVININRLNAKGAATFGQALAGPPINSSIIDYNLEIFPEIYDETGDNYFAVEQTAYNVGPYATQLNTGYTFKLGADVANDKVTVNVVESSEQHLIQSYTQDTQTGKLYLNLNALPEGGKERTARIILTANAGNVTMTRSILLTQFKYYRFQTVSINDYSPYVPETPIAAGDELRVGFTIPEDFPDYRYPLEVAIRTISLTPRGISLPLRTYPDGGYAYIYTISKSMADANPTRRYEVPFSANEPDTREAIRLSAQNFADAYTGYNMGVIEGKVQYRLNGTLYDLPADKNVTGFDVSTGWRLNMPSEGRYRILIPLTVLSSDDNSRYAHMETVFSALVPEEVTAGNFVNHIYEYKGNVDPYRASYQADNFNPADVDIVLEHKYDLLSGLIEARNYATQNYGQLILANTATGADNGTFELTVNGETISGTLVDNRYTVRIPVDLADNTPVTVMAQNNHAVYVSSDNIGLIQERYEYTTTIGALKANPKLRMTRSQLHIIGNATRKWVIDYPMETNNALRATVNSKTVNVSIPEEGRYDVTFGSGIEVKENDNITFRMTRGLRNYSGTYTLRELRNNTAIVVE